MSSLLGGENPRNVSLYLLLIVLPTLAWGQSLGDAARKERERREKNKKEGLVVREFSEEEIFGTDEEGDDVDGEGRSSDGEQPSASIAGESSSQESGTLVNESRDRRRDEAEWRSRFQDAKRRVETAREHVQILKELNLMPGERYIDARGNTVIRSLEQLRRLVAAADAELAAAEQALSDLREEARRAGVPPGWTR